MKHCSHSWGNLSLLTLNLAFGYSVRLLLCTLRPGGVQWHSRHRTKPRKSHHSLPSNSMSFQATSPHFKVVIWMAERVHYRSLWILSGLCKHIWHVSAVELQFTKANYWTYGAAPAAIFGRNHDSSSYASCRRFRKTVRIGMDKDEGKRQINLLGLASSIIYRCFGVIKSLSTSRKKICCSARTVSLRTSGWQKHCARDSCVHPTANSTGCTW